jgi:hypothetical protein
LCRHVAPQGPPNRHPILKADACAHKLGAQRTILDQILAKEGEITVGSRQRFPLDEPAAGPLTDRAAPRRTQSSSAEPQQTWPVLARIADVAKSSEQETSHEPLSSRSTYRLDAPHAAAPSPSHVTPPPQARPLPRSDPNRPTATASATDAQRQLRALQAVPLPIRITVEAWRIIQPHRELIRFAAMLTLMAAGGMSMVMMMGERFAPVDVPTRPAATTADHTTANETETQHAELQPAFDPMTAPDADTTSLAPTAAGPLAPVSHPLLASESTAAPAAPPYPTTPFAESSLPQPNDDTLPQARTTEPEVARLRGDLLDTKTR